MNDQPAPLRLEPGPASGPLDVPSGEVHLWWADLDSPDWPDATGLPAAERARASRRIGAGARDRCVASRWALRQVLARYLGRDPAQVDLVREKGGKPRLRQAAERLEFNLSHSGPVAIVAVGGSRAVGVDVERIEPNRDLVRLADRVLPAEDAAAVRAATGADRADTFYERWARHEALLKCDGRGLHDPVPDTPVAVRSLPLAAGYAAAVAVAGEKMPSLRCWRQGPRPEAS